MLSSIREMRLTALELGKKAKNKGAHFGSSMGAMEIFACLYGGVLKKEPGKTGMGQDVLIVGKGHCVLAYYAALAQFGYISKELLNTYDEDGSMLQGHPMANDSLGIDFSSGSLGMALSQGVGVALSRKKMNDFSHVFVLLGDGECNEGAVWEAAMAAAHFKLNNLTVIVDRNRLQYDGDTESVMALGDLKKKWESFGFTVYNTDGNDVEQLMPVLVECRENKSDAPCCVIANTIKGKGISFMENKREWHHKVITEEEYLQAVKEVEENHGN
ncbi:MAG: transketolase [Eubacterium sp.]|nr:transketolase [Eubacterium sp.]